MVTFKVIAIGNKSVFDTPEVVASYDNMKQATTFAEQRKLETGRDYRVNCDGISYFDTIEGDDLSNITSL